MLAFHEAMKAGADGFECDLRLTADGHLVVFHDDDLQRLCGCTGSIETMSLSEVQKLRVLKTEAVPTLDQLLNDFHTTRINLEIKHSSRDAIVTEAVLRALTKIRPTGEILISSFSPDVLKSLNTMDSQRKLGALGILVETSHLEDLPNLTDDLHPQTWNVPKQVLNQPWHLRWKDFKVPPLWVWTVDEPHQWQSILQSKLPFEAIITNKPDALHQFLSCFTGVHSPS